MIRVLVISSWFALAAFAFTTRPLSLFDTHRLSKPEQHTPIPIRQYDTYINGSPIKQRLTFNSPPLNGKDPPRLILISGCPGTGANDIYIICHEEHAIDILLIAQLICHCINTFFFREIYIRHVFGIGTRNIEVYIHGYGTGCKFMYYLVLFFTLLSLILLCYATTLSFMFMYY